MKKLVCMIMFVVSAIGYSNDRLNIVVDDFDGTSSISTKPIMLENNTFIYFFYNDYDSKIYIAAGMIATEILYVRQGIHTVKVKFDSKEIIDVGIFDSEVFAKGDLFIAYTAYTENTFKIVEMIRFSFDTITDVKVSKDNATQFKKDYIILKEYLALK